MFDPALGERAGRRRLDDPFLPAGDLAVIAGAFPALSPLVAAHPALYPALAQRLRSLGRPDVNSILDAREDNSDDAVPTVPAPQLEPLPASHPAVPSVPSAPEPEPEPGPPGSTLPAVPSAQPATEATPGPPAWQAIVTHGSAEADHAPSADSGPGLSSRPRRPVRKTTNWRGIVIVVVALIIIAAGIATLVLSLRGDWIDGGGAAIEATTMPPVVSAMAVTASSLQ